MAILAGALPNTDDFMVATDKVLARRYNGLCLEARERHWHFPDNLEGVEVAMYAERANSS